MTRFLIPIPLLLATMGIGSCGSRRLGSLGAADGSVDAGGECEYAGIPRRVGSSFPGSDGCNDCICVAAGQVSCSMRACIGQYSACQFGSGIGRVLIAKRDAPNICVVLILDRPGTNAFGLTVPAGWGVEAAFTAPDALQTDCQMIAPPAGAVLASAVTGSVTITNASIDVNATLTFAPNDPGVDTEYLVASALDYGPLCSGSVGPAPACTYGDAGTPPDGGTFNSVCPVAGCPAGTTCVVEVGGVGGGAGEYCALIPSECRGTPSCACMSSCVCTNGLGGRPETCTAQNGAIACDNGIR